MRKLRIYLDTSVVNFLFATDAPDFMRVTEEFFGGLVATGRCEAFVSDVVLAEMGRTPDPVKRGRLLGVVRDLGLPILELTAEASRLASVYVREGVIPTHKLEDAQHIAIAVCNQMDVLLSWNFKHLANLHKQIAVRSVNEREGYYYPLALINPMEVLGEDD